jgi:hypothetical protein
MGALTDTTDTAFKHVLSTADGGQIRYVAAHGRIYTVKQGPGGRQVVTTPISIERARLMARRLDELCAVAEADRPSKDR